MMRFFSLVVLLLLVATSSGFVDASTPQAPAMQAAPRLSVILENNCKMPGGEIQSLWGYLWRGTTPATIATSFSGGFSLAPGSSVPTIFSPGRQIGVFRTFHPAGQNLVWVGPNGTATSGGNTTKPCPAGGLTAAEEIPAPRENFPLACYPTGGVTVVQFEYRVSSNHWVPIGSPEKVNKFLQAGGPLFAEIFMNNEVGAEEWPQDARLYRCRDTATGTVVPQTVMAGRTWDTIDLAEAATMNQ